MKKFIYIFLILLFTSSVFSNEDSLTIQQQLERLQREVSDISKSIFSNSETSINKDMVSNLSAIDLRIYDLEKDVKSLNANLEEILFQIDDLVKKINDLETLSLSLDNSFSQFKNQNNKKDTELFEDNNTSSNQENSLGSLSITKENTNLENENILEKNNLEDDKLDMKPEDQFQEALDNIRKKNWDEAKSQFQNFINNNPNNQLAGSAHYWLGELYILEKEYRNAALIFAEGFQKYPDSIKAPDMLFKLSQSLYNVEKFDESCNTMAKFLKDYPKNKLFNKVKSQFSDYNCIQQNE